MSEWVTGGELTKDCEACAGDSAGAAEAGLSLWANWEEEGRYAKDGQSPVVGSGSGLNSLWGLPAGISSHQGRGCFKG